MSQLITYPNKLLTTPCVDVDLQMEIQMTMSNGDVIQSTIEELSKEMESALFQHRAMGIAANQLGHPLRMFSAIINNEPMTFINPEIVERSGDSIRSLEPCLSLPGITANLNNRDSFVTVEYTDLKGERLNRKLMSMEAILAQHECDHLNGETVFNRMGSAQRQLKKKKYMKNVRKMKKFSKIL